jgi:DNA adenine methylase
MSTASRPNASNSTRIRPVLKWAGGKSGLLSQISPLFPREFRHYYEPFFGGGAVFFSLNFTGKSYINDSNRELIELYEVIRDEPQKLMRALDALSEHYSESFYYQLRKDMPRDKIARAARTIFLNKTGFNGLYRQNAKGEFNVPFGKRISCPSLYDRENFLHAAASLRSAVLSSMDFEELINKAGDGDFIYCDPPYEPISRTSSFNAYQGGGFSQQEQRRLKEACIRAKCRGAFVIISNSSAEFIKDLYSDCDLSIISAKRAINSNGTSRGAIDEVVVVLNPDRQTFQGSLYAKDQSVHLVT